MKAGASELGGKRTRIGISISADGMQTRVAEDGLGFWGPHPTAMTPEVERARLSRFFRSNHSQPVGFSASARDFGDVLVAERPTDAVRPPVASRIAASGGVRSIRGRQRVARSQSYRGRPRRGLKPRRRAKIRQYPHDRRGDFLISIETGWDNYRVWAHSPGLRHRHRAPTPYGRAS